MASRPAFLAIEEKPFFKEVNIDFEFYTGFAITQKHKSIDSLHTAFSEKYPNLNVLEVSRRSKDSIGMQLSAFNLKLTSEKNGFQYPVECIFQSSKVFENGGPYIDLMSSTPAEAKKDERLKNSGNLKCFKYNDEEFPLEPKTLFYHWIYIHALLETPDVAKKSVKYDAFTDIEFNPLKSINCQARATAIFVGLSKSGELEKYLKGIEVFKDLYPEKQQMSLF